MIASGSVQTRARRIPKVAEKKVKIDESKPVKSSPQPKPKVANVSSQSWYTPAPVQPPATGALQRSVSDVTPQTFPSKVDVGRSNSAKEARNHLRTGSETRRDGVEPTKRHVRKHLITHTDCPWVESNGDPHPHAGYMAHHQQPIRSATMGSYESDETAVEGETTARVDAKEDGWAPAKDVQDTLRPTVRLVSKPLPDPPTFDSLSSRWSQSTGSVYSDGSPFRYDKILDLFPEPPKDKPDADYPSDWENSNSLSTPPVFMSCSNHSSSSVVTVTPEATLDPPTVRPLKLKVVPEPKATALVHLTPRASRSFAQVQDSLVILRGRGRPQPPTKGSIHTSIRTTGTASNLRRRSSSVTHSHSRSQPERRSNPANDRALGEPSQRQISEEIKGYERREGTCEANFQAGQDANTFYPPEFGYKLNYRGEKRLLRGLESDRPDKVKRRRRRLFGGHGSERPDKVKQRKWL